MFRVEIDKAANLLKISYAGRVVPKETKPSVQKAPEVLAELRPGFRLLTDMSALDSIDLACVPHMERLMDVCNERGVEMVVRVIPDPHKDIGLNIMSLFHYHRRVRIVTCDSLEEARKILMSDP